MKNSLSRAWFWGGRNFFVAFSPVGRNMKGTIPPKMNCLVLFLFFVLFSANAATWYVDSSVAASGNGTSWASAWKNFSNISGVSAGDIVYISGGPSGSSQIYSLSTWSPPAGTSGNPITFQIGQDSLHNGTAYFSGGGSSSAFLNAGNYVTISGDAGDGQMHFAFTNMGYVCSLSSSSGLTLSYINMGSLSTGGSTTAGVLDIAASVGFDMDNCYCVDSNPNSDHFSYNRCFGNARAFDQQFFHNNTIFVPCNTSGTPGADGLQWIGYGYSIYSNNIISYPTSYGGSQHPDGWQTTGGDAYCKIYANVILNFQDSCLYGGIDYGPISFFLIYNNIGAYTFGGGPQEGMFIAYDAPVSYTLTNCVIANNILVDSAFAGGIADLQSSGTPTFINDIVANNISLNSGAMGNDSRVAQYGNVSVTSAQAATDFVSYTHYGGTNNNLHLLATALALRAMGTNLSSYFTVDKDGNPRPASGAWDIGPYVYGGSNTNPVLSVQPSASLSFGSVLTNTTAYLTNAMQNSGGGTVTGTATISSSGSSPFSIISGTAYSLGAGQNTNLIVLFSPGAVGSFSNTITFTVTGGTGTTGTLSGAGVATYPAPQVSAVSQSGSDVDSNTSGLQVFAGYNESYSGSASDPSGLPLSWQWIYTINGGTSNVLQNGTGTVATVSYTYPASSAGSTYVWKLRVSNGYSTSESDLTVGVEAPPVVTGSLTFQPSAGNIFAPFVLSSGYVSQSVTTGTNGGQLIFFFQTTNSNIFAVEALVDAPNTAANSFYVNIDAPPTDPTNIWDLTLTTGFTNEIVTWRGNGTNDQMSIYPQQNFPLNAGLHQLIIEGREAGTELGPITIVQLQPAPPPPFVMQ